MSRTPNLTRRAFLGGAGALVALPLLESLWRSPAGRIAQADAPLRARRLVFMYAPNGMHMPAWIPAQTGAGYALPEILRPLEPLRDQVLVLSGLDNFAASSQGDGAGDHARGTASFLTCAHVEKTDGAGIKNGVSVDQLAAQHYAGQTPYASLELGIEGGDSTGGCDSGYSCAYSRNISWSGPQTPMAKETSPQALFDRLFRGADARQTAEQILRRRRYKKSVLDHALADAALLQSKLGSVDRRKVDEYLTGVRELETRLESARAAECEAGTRPGEPANVEEHVRLMLDLMVLALQCDQTRVISFMLANAGSGRSFPFIGVDQAHHELSHHQGDPEKHRQLVKIDTWEVEQLAYFLERLRAVQDPDGTTLLDSTLVFFSSEIADGDRHSHADLPVLLCGRGDGAVRPGRHVRYPEGTPMANLFLFMLKSVGATTAKFGDDGKAPLGELA